VQETKKEAE